MKKTDILGAERHSKEFQADLKVLTACAPEECAKIVTRYATQRRYSQEELLEDIAKLEVDAKEVESLARILLYFARELLNRRFPDQNPENEPVWRERLKQLGVDEDGQKNFIKFVNLCSKSAGDVALEAARAHFTQVGPPMIKSATAVCDLRCLYDCIELEEEEKVAQR